MSRYAGAPSGFPTEVSGAQVWAWNEPMLLSDAEVEDAGYGRQDDQEAWNGRKVVDGLVPTRGADQTALERQADAFLLEHTGDAMRVDTLRDVADMQMLEYRLHPVASPDRVAYRGAWRPSVRSHQYPTVAVLDVDGAPVLDAEGNALRKPHAAYQVDVDAYGYARVVLTYRTVRTAVPGSPTCTWQGHRRITVATRANARLAATTVRKEVGALNRRGPVVTGWTMGTSTLHRRWKGATDEQRANAQRWADVLAQTAEGRPVDYGSHVVFVDGKDGDLRVRTNRDADMERYTLVTFARRAALSGDVLV